MSQVNTTQKNVMINPDDAVMLLIDHQSGLFQLVKDIQICHGEVEPLVPGRMVCGGTVSACHTSSVRERLRVGILIAWL